MSWRARTVLVTGSEGFIGSHLVERLVELDATVRAFVLYNSFNSWGWLEDLDPAVRGRIEVVVGDLRDPAQADEAVRGMDTVLHLAALVSIPFSYRAPAAYVETNVGGTLNVLQAARRHDTRCLVVTSTSEVYGTAQMVPMTEQHPLLAQSPYAATKIAADQLALAFHRSYGLPVAILRPFNTFGPRQSARAIIPTVLAQALGGAREVRVGSTHPTRDFTFVRDTVEGFIKIADRPEAVGEVVNLGTGRDIAIGDLIETIAGVIGRPLRAIGEDQRKRPARSEVERLCADATKARTLLQWTPQYRLEDGLALTATWIEKHLDIYKSEIFNY